jgi:peptide/nickel transport system permease protein
VRRYVVQRVLLIVPVLIGVTALVAGLIRLTPGDAVMVRIEEAGHVDAAHLEAARRALGLDRSFPEQYAIWLGGVLRGDLGNSFITERPVVGEIARALPVTVELAVLSLLVAFLLGVPVGAISAVRRGRWPDRIGRLVSIGGLSMPSFWIGTLVLLYFAIWFRWIPPITYVPFFEDPWRNIQQFGVPALALGAHFSAVAMRMTRSALLEVIRQDYIRTAYSKGLRERAVVIRHALKNAMVPVVTVLGVQFGYLLGGTVLIETIFNMPGLGRLTLDAVTQRDYPQLQGDVLVVALMVVLVTLVVDLSYGWLDPRIRHA